MLTGILLFNIHYMTKPTTIINGEKILSTRIIWTLALIMLTTAFITNQMQIKTIRKVVLEQRNIVERHEEEIRTLQNKKYVTPEELERVRKSGYEYSWEVYKEMRDFIYKAEARIPTLKRI